MESQRVSKNSFDPNILLIVYHTFLKKTYTIFIVFYPTFIKFRKKTTPFMEWLLLKSDLIM